MIVDGRIARGERTRTSVLDAAVELTSTVGLDGLSLGQLAATLGVSKSGLFAHWRSKEELQLATIDRAGEQWRDRIIRPALRAPAGVRRLWAAHEHRLAFYRDSVLPGGCFFAKVEFEYAARPGPVRDRIAAALADWTAFLERLAAEAITAGEISADADARQVAYEIEAFGVAAVVHSRLLAPETSYAYARAAALHRLRALCPDPTLLPEV